MSRPLIHIDPTWAMRRDLLAGADYLYRTHVIRVEDDGYGVYDTNTDRADGCGWGLTLFDAMAVVNEIMDEGPRRKS